MPTITSISRRKTFERLGLLSLVVIFLGAFAAPAMADVGRRDHEFTADSVVKPTGQSRRAWWAARTAHIVAMNPAEASDPT